MLAVATYAALGSAASSSLVITLDVPSAVEIVNNCSAPSATNLGTILPDTRATTATGSGACAVTWGATNDGTTLRMYQSDRTGVALASRSDVWTDGRTESADMVLGMHAATNSMVMASMESGWVARSSNGGGTWTTDYLNTGHWIYDVDSAPLDTDTWVAVGGDGAVRSTNNGMTSLPGAATWNDHTPALVANGWPASADVQGVAVLSASTWMIAGDQGWIARTTNGGGAWTTYQLAAQPFFTDIDAVSASEYVAVGDGKLYRTTTSGPNAAAWSAGMAPTNGNSQFLSELTVGDATHVYSQARDGSTFLWNGTTFDQLAVNAGNRALRISAIATSTAAPATVVAVGEQGSGWRSTNSGGAWARSDLGNASWYLASTAPSASVVYAGALNGDIVKSIDGGATWSLVRTIPSNTAFVGIDADPTTGRTSVAVGSDGTAARTTNKGATWTTVSTATTEDLLDVEFASSTHVWAVGKGGTIRRSTDGGQTWTAQVSNTTETLRSIHTRNRHRAWAVGDNGTVLVTSNGGATWSVYAAGTSQDLVAIASSSDTNLVALGGDGRIRRSTTGGTTWISPTTSSGGPWEGIQSTAPNTFVAISYFGTAFRSTDNGDTWSYLTESRSTAVSVDGSGAFMTVAWWDGGSTTTDGGVTWTTHGVGSGWGGDAIAAVDANSAHAASARGILSSTDEHAAVARQVADYGAGATFGGASSTSTFGVCLQSLSGAALSSGWTVDGGTCTATDTDPWRGIGTTPIDVGTVASGATGTATFVWGARPRVDQPPGRYTAGITFEAVAPNE
ncbi:MAG: hypothetical protein JWL76_1730 [Thermoleophilia bacterium]|nr:hypothetical protein [Thermoleophilia bacterium]